MTTKTFFKFFFAGVLVLLSMTYFCMYIYPNLTFLKPHPPFFTRSIVHFFIRLGCGQAPPNLKNHPVQLQYSTNGGITWNLIEEMDFNNGSNVAKHILLELPGGARSNMTRVRWWQASHEGSFLDEWAIDQVDNN